MADPLDKQLVEAVLTRPRRAKADVEEARLATRNLRAAKVVLPKVALHGGYAFRHKTLAEFESSLSEY